MDFLLDPVDRFPLCEVVENELPGDQGEVAEAQIAEPEKQQSLEEIVAARESSLGLLRGVLRRRDEAGLSEQAAQVSSPDSEGSSVKQDPQAPGWTKRLRVGKLPEERPHYPGRMGALEQSIKKFAENPSEDVIQPTLGMTFDTLGEAYDFYNLYSWEHGFGIRYGKSRLNVEKTKCMQEIVCGCSGKPDAENSRSLRCGCPAMIRLLRAEDNGWFITEHRVTHNHSLSLTCGERVHWPSHKHIDGYTKDIVKKLRENNINM